jgi:hypothetical protein
MRWADVTDQAVNFILGSHVRIWVSKTWGPEPKCNMVHLLFNWLNSWRKRAVTRHIVGLGWDPHPTILCDAWNAEFSCEDTGSASLGTMWRAEGVRHFTWLLTSHWFTRESTVIINIEALSACVVELWSEFPARFNTDVGVCFICGTRCVS